MTNTGVTTFPTTLDDFTNVGTATYEDDSGYGHGDLHNQTNEALEAIEAKVGIDASAVTTSHDYKLSGVAGTDKAASKIGIETLTNKTLTSPSINNGVFTGGGALLSKIIQATRDMTAASGDVSYTGVGFAPTAIQCWAMFGLSESMGWADSAKNGICIPRLYDGSYYTVQNYLTYIHQQVGLVQIAVVKTYDADGFTLTWTRVGTTTTGTGQLIFLCFK